MNERSILKERVRIAPEAEEALAGEIGRAHV